MTIIKRTRLLELLATPYQHHWLIEAGGGYGKSVVLKQLARERPQTVFVTVPRASRGSDFIATLRNALEAAAAHESATDLTSELIGAGLTVVIDDAHKLSEQDAAWLRSIIEAPDCRSSFVLSGRLLPIALMNIRSAAEVGSLTTWDLRFDHLEITKAIDHIEMPVGHAEMIRQMTDGWPVAVRHLVRQLERSAAPLDTLAEIQRNDSLLASTLEQYLTTSDDPYTIGLGSLAKLGRFDLEIAEMIGPADLVPRLLEIGVPITRSSDGWLEIPPQLRSTLTRDDRLSRALPVEVIEHLSNRKDSIAAIQSCLALGDRQRAADLIASLDLEDESRIEASQLNACMVAIGTAAEAAPRCLVVASRLNATNGRIHDGYRYIERAMREFRRVDPDGNDETHVEALLMLGTFRVFDRDVAEATQIVAKCDLLIDASRASQLAGHLRDLRGLVLHASGGDGSVEAAIAEMTEAFATWQELQQPRAAAVTAFRLTAALRAQGRQADALALLESLPSIGPMSMLNRARLEIERAWLLPHFGRAEEVRIIIEEPRRIAKALSLDWIVGWALAAEVFAASCLEQDREVADLAQRYEDHAYKIMNPATTAIYTCSVAESLARCAHFDAASRMLESARIAPGVPEWVVALTEASIGARCGRGAEALTALDELAVHAQVELTAQWLIALLRAYSHWSLGDTAEAEKWLGEAYREAAELGQPHLPDVVEPRLVAQIHGRAPMESSNRIRVIELFDEFRVRIGDIDAPIALGHASTLVKIVCIAKGRIMIDQAIDLLWPESDLEVGRRRLRNVLTRVRTATGNALVRDGDQIVISPNFSCDYVNALASADEIQPNSPTAAVEHAIALMDRELLPADRYEDWAEWARMKQRHVLDSLIELRAVQAIDAGNEALAKSWRAMSRRASAPA